MFKIMRHRLIGSLLIFLVFIVEVHGQSVCNTFMKKMYISATEVVPSGGTRNFSTITPVATSVIGKIHWYVGYGNALVDILMRMLCAPTTLASC